MLRAAEPSNLAQPPVRRNQTGGQVIYYIRSLGEVEFACQQAAIRSLRGCLRIGFIYIGFGYYESPHSEVKQGWTVPPPVAYYVTYLRIFLFTLRRPAGILLWCVEGCGMGAKMRNDLFRICVRPFRCMCVSFSCLPFLFCRVGGSSSRCSFGGRKRRSLLLGSLLLGDHA